MTAGLSLIALRYEPAAPESPANGARRAFHFRDMVAIELLPNAFFAATMAVATGINNAYLVMVGNERNIANIGFYFIVYSAVLLVLRPLSGRVADRKGVVFVVVPGYFMAAVAMALIGSSGILLPILFAAVLAAAGAGAMPAIQADCIRRLDSSRRTAATGTYLIGMDSGVAGGQVFGGMLSDSFGFKTTYTTVSCLMLFGLGLYLLYRKFGKHPSSESVPKH